MTSSYCQPNESVFWFPIAPGVETLPGLPAETVNETPLPANGVLAPEGFDVQNPDLCELFDVLLPTGTDPVYGTTVSPTTVIPPYNQIISYDARLRSYITLQSFPYKITNTTNLELKIRPGIQAYLYPTICDLVSRSTVNVQFTLQDYIVAEIPVKLRITASSAFLPAVLLHLNGDVGSTTFVNQGYLPATISSFNPPVIQTQLSKFGGSAAYFYDNPSVITVEHPSLAVIPGGPGFSVSGWIWFDPEQYNKIHWIYSPGGSLAPDDEGIGVQVGSYSNYFYTGINGLQNSYYYGNNINATGQWVYFVLQKYNLSTNWSLSFSYVPGVTYSYSFNVGASNTHWYNTMGRHSFGGQPRSIVSYCFTGAMNELAIFPGTQLLSSSSIGADQVPTEPYDPPSLDISIVVKVLSTVSVIYQQIYSESTAIIPVVLRIARKSEALIRVVRYTGDGVNDRIISTPNVSGDLVWIKNYGGSGQSVFVDSLRGGNYYNHFQAYYNDQYTQTINSFNTESLTVSDQWTINYPSYTYHLVIFGNTNAAYVDNTGYVPVTIRSNTDFGFSICKWTGDGNNSSYRSIPHGLGDVPDLILVKSNQWAYEPRFFGSILGANKTLSCYSSASIDNWSSILFTSNFVKASSTIGSYFINPNSSTIMYAFRSIPGATKIGKYTGFAGSSKFVPLDFKPSFVLVKQVTGYDSDRYWMAHSRDIGYSWRIFDYSDDNEFTSDITLHANGFSFPQNSIYNRTSQLYVYMAFRDTLVEAAMPSSGYSGSITGTANLIRNIRFIASQGSINVTGSANVQLDIFLYRLQAETYAGAITYNPATLTGYPIVSQGALSAYTMALVDASLVYSTVASDPYYDNVSLLLPMSGVNNSTSFIDKSQNGLAVTPNGDVKISTAQFRTGSSSAYFDGNGDYLTFSTTGSNNLNGDFTVEAWIRLSAMPTSDSWPGNWSGWFVVVSQGTPSVGDGWDLLVGQTLLGFQSSDSLILSGTHSMTTNTWYHVAAARCNGTLRLFVNGVIVATTSFNSTLGGGSSGYIGCETGQGAYFNGYMQDVRITRGICRYVGLFIPPTSELSPSAQTSLVLHMDGTDNSTTFTDSSATNATVTVAGNAKLSTAQKMFGTASASFDGSGDYLTIDSQSVATFGTSDFTIECWVYLTGAPGGYSDFGGTIFDTRNSGTSTTGLIVYYTNAYRLNVWVGSAILTSYTPIPQNQWCHIAVVRKSSRIYIFINGKENGSVANSTNFTDTPFTIGTVYDSRANTSYLKFQGYIDEVVITKNTAKYISNFGNPGALPATTGVTYDDPYYAYVSLLLSCNGTNNSTTFTDSSSSNRTVTAYGDAKLSTAQYKYGTASAYFDGTGDYLTATSPNMSGNWTVECWVYPTTASQQTIVSFNNGSNAGINIWMNSSRQLVVDDGANAQSAFTGNTLTLNTWNHVAIVRMDGTTFGYINGTNVGSNTFTPQTTSAISIGRYNLSPYYYFVGYIDDLRITSGIARYTSAFRVMGPFASTAVVPDIVEPYTANTSLMLPMTGFNYTNSFFDKSANQVRLIENSNVQIVPTVSKFGPTSAYFDGTDDALDLPAGPGFTFTGDFTIEFWVYRESSQATYPTWFELGLYTDGILMRPRSSDDVYVNSSNLGVLSGVATNVWQHVAVVRYGTSFMVFLDGGLRMSATISGTINSSGNLRIGGSRHTTGQNFRGYIDEFRVIKGVALYKAAFVPPQYSYTDTNLNDPYFSSVSMLLHMNGANNSTTFTDNSISNLAITANGDAKISTTQSKFGGASGAFDGNGDYLTLSPGNRFAFDTGSFTIEMWVRLSGISGNFYFIDARNSGQTTNWALLYNNNGTIEWYNGTTSVNRTWSPSLNTWYHLALVRNGSTCQFYVDGAALGASFTDSTNLSVSPTTSYIGARYSIVEFINGYIDELRITKGIARYTSNFIPSTLPFYNTAAITADPNFSNVSLLMHMNGTNGSTTFTDSSANAVTATVYGNAQISTAQSRFGGASAYFDGTGDGLTIPSSSVFDFGSGDFTIECWICPTAISGADRAVMTKGWQSGSYGAWLIYWSNANNRFSFYASSTGGSWDIASDATILSAPVLNRWYHIAITRSGSIFRNFVDGCQTNSWTNSGSLVVNAAHKIAIGSGQTGTDGTFGGYIDEVRLTKGVARYTSNFYLSGPFPNNS